VFHRAAALAARFFSAVAQRSAPVGL